MDSDADMEKAVELAQFSPSKDVDLPIPTPVRYRQYKRRFAGLTGFIAVNIVAAMSWSWFGPISSQTSTDFGITLDQVNWLGNITAAIYLLAAPLTPMLCSRFGLRRTCDIGVVLLVVSGWVRYLGTLKSLSHGNAYALLLFGQLFASIAQTIFQVLGPKYSQTWFGLQSRTTATMIIAISNPIGSALGQIISPSAGTPRHSVLILGIMCTAVFPFLFLIGDAPPTPPTYAGSQPSQSIMSFFRAVLGMSTPPQAYMTRRERIDFAIITTVFGIFVGASGTFSVLCAQILTPVGYSSVISGLMSAVMLLAGILAAIATAPLFDRVFTRHLAVTIKSLAPFVGVAWFSLIWAVIPNNAVALFCIMAVIGMCSLIMLPVGLELSVELTRNAEASTATIWFFGNLYSVMFVECEGALRAGPHAHPPSNMRRALIFNSVFNLVAAGLALGLQGKQVRRALDEEKARTNSSQ